MTLVLASNSVVWLLGGMVNSFTTQGAQNETLSILVLIGGILWAIAALLSDMRDKLYR